jgi:hypothetical protein
MALSDYDKKYARRNWSSMTVPRQQPRDTRRVIVHNQVVPVSLDQPHGVDGFRVWTQRTAPMLVECDCGWSGLRHYRFKGLVPYP